MGGWQVVGGSHAWDDQHNDGLEKLSKMMYHTWGKKLGGWWFGGWVVEVNHGMISIIMGLKICEK